MSSPLRENIRLPFFGRVWSSPSIPLHPRGALRDRHERWRRDAMDASSAEDERARCGRRSRVVPVPRCWDQASCDEHEATVARKPGAPRRPRISRNPLRRECRLFRLPCRCLRAQRCSLLARGLTGAASIRHSLRPPSQEGQGFRQTSGASRREKAMSCQREKAARARDLRGFLEVAGEPGYSAETSRKP